MIEIEQKHMNHVRAIDFSQADEPAVKSAERVARSVVMQLGHGSEMIRLDFTGMRGVASSYFNVLFREIVVAVGRHEFEERVELHFETPTQRLVASRSRDAVLKAG